MGLPAADPDSIHPVPIRASDLLLLFVRRAKPLVRERVHGVSTGLDILDTRGCR
jgi:hypothetical protein